MRGTLCFAPIVNANRAMMGRAIVTDGSVWRGEPRKDVRPPPDRGRELDPPPAVDDAQPWCSEKEPSLRGQRFALEEFVNRLPASPVFALALMLSAVGTGASQSWAQDAADKDAAAENTASEEAKDGDEAEGDKAEDPWGTPVDDNARNGEKTNPGGEPSEPKAATAKANDSNASGASAQREEISQPRERARPDGPWRNPFVAERAPNRWGQTGLRHLGSARPGRSGDVDVGLFLRGFYSPDFLVPGVADTNVFAGGSAFVGTSLFDLIELSLATRFAGNQNGGVSPQTTYALGDIAASAKAGYGIGPIVVGADLRLVLPPAPQGILPDFQNVSATGTGLLTLDLYDAYSLPFRVHFNGGYTFQAARFAPDGPRDLYYANDAQTHLTAMAREQWFYDSVTAGLGLEVPLPFVTPYLEVWGRSSILVRPDRGVGGAPYNFLSDPHVTLSPGLRVTPAPGLNVDLGVDVGVLGTAGFLQPDVSRVVHGQPINPLWVAQVAISYTFQPFETESRRPSTGRDAGRATSSTSSSNASSASGASAIAGCAVETGTGKTIEDAIVIFENDGLPRLATDADGCFSLPNVAAGTYQVEVRHPDYEPGQAVVRASNPASSATVALVAVPRKGTFKGFITNSKDQNVDATIEIAGDVGEPATVTAKDGTFALELDPGSYQAVVKAEGYLQQGAKVVVEKNGRTIRNFVLKRIPKKRISEIKKGKIEIKTRIPFAYSKARLLRAAEFILDDVVDVILSNPQLKRIRIEGHTDNTGDAEYNQQLSEDRAAAVRDYLIDKGVPADRLVAKGYGSNKPIARNDRESGRAKNRRVDFVIVDDTSTAATP